MGTKDGSNQTETADCDREADILPWDGRWSPAEVKVYQRRMAKRKPETGNRKRRWLVLQMFRTDAKPSLTAQHADDFGDLVFLKEANRGDACGASIEAGASVI
jgi:hypothetical protein